MQPRPRNGWRGLPKSKRVVVDEVWAATPEHLEKLRHRPILPKTQLTVIRDGHHRVAQLAALGLPNREIARLTGRSVNGVSRIRNNPAMADLIVEYRKEALQEAQSMEAEHIRLLMEAKVAAARHIHYHATEAEDGDISIRDAVLIDAHISDRLGPIKAKVQISSNGDFASRLEAAIQRANAAKTVQGSDESLKPRAEASGGHDVRPPVLNGEIIPPPRGPGLIRRRI